MVASRMEENLKQHLPVLLNEVMQHLAIEKNGIYLDATFGRGGHTEAILERLGLNGKLYAMDKDPEAIAYAKERFAKDQRFKIQQGSFKNLKNFLEQENVFGKLNGVLFDLGVSSPQLDNPDRGFSFLREGKLDMRMDTTRGMDAASWLASISEEELANVLWQYGEERFSRRIARAIIYARQEKTIENTLQLANIIASAIPKWEKGKHPATRSFQAIRIAVNQELSDLSEGLTDAFASLKKEGRLLVISFHSLEDRLVKHFMQHKERGERLPAKLPIKSDRIQPELKRLMNPIKPTLQEVADNPRSRSAVLRIAEKLV